MQVNRGRPQGSVPQKFLDDPDVGALFEKMGRKGMPECVERGILLYPAVQKDLFEPLQDTLFTVCLTCRAAFEKICLGPVVPVIFPELFQQPHGKERIPVFVTLAPADSQLHPVAVDITKFKAGHLAQPQSGGIGGRDKAIMFSVYNSVEDMRYFLFGKDDRKGFGKYWPLDLYRIPVSSGNIPEKNFEGTDSLVYARGRQVFRLDLVEKILF